MSARPNPRRTIPARVAAAQDRQRSGGYGPHRGCRRPRRTTRAAAIASSLAGE